MPLIALVLVLAAAGFHATWNLTLHTTEDRPATMAVAGLAAGIVLVPAMVVAPPWQALPFIVASGAAETVYALFLSAAYARGALAIAYPIGRGTAPLLVTLGGWLLLAERPGPAAIAGAVSLATGLTLVALAGRRAGQSGAIGFALLTGTAISTYSLIDAHAVRAVQPVSYIGAVLGVQGLLLAALVRFDRARLRRALPAGLRVAVGSTASYLLVLFAFQQAGAGRVATLREISVLLGIFLSRRRAGAGAGELGPRVWLGAALVVLGAVLTAI